MNLFQISSNDQSIYYLGRIFGNVGNVLSGTGPMLLGEMFRAFNTALLGFAALVIVYTTIVGIINTAAQGEFLGNKWNKVWTPIRMVVGIISLFPLPGSGYCLIQVLMMWFIMQGVGAADTVWSATVDYLLKGGTVQTPPPTAYGDGNATSIKQIYHGLVCQAAIEQFYCPKATDEKDKEWCNRDHDFSVKKIPNGFDVSYNMGPEGVCGKLTIDKSKSPHVQLAQAQSYIAIIPTLKRIAAEQVRRVESYTQFKKKEDKTPIKDQWWLNAEADKQVDPDCSPDKGCTWELGKLYAEYAINPYVGSNFVRDAANLYTGYLLNAATQSSHRESDWDTVESWATGDSKTRINNREEIQLRSALEKSKINGWAFAGGYYYLIASMNNKVVDDYLATIEVKNVDRPSTKVKWFQNLEQKIFDKILTQYQSAEQITYVITDEQRKGGGEGTFAAGIGNGVSSLGQALVKGWMQALTSNGDGKEVAVNPIIKLQSFGRWILDTIQIAYLAFLAVMIVTVGASSTCAAVNGFGFGVSAGYTYILAPLLGFMGAMFVFAGLLSVYMPMIPYVLFTFGVIGWLIATIETMIAAPIIAIGIMLPEGGHEVWGHSGPAGKIILNIMLRPSLMIFGMMTGMLLSYVVVTFINAAFLGVMNQVGAPGLVEVVLFMMGYTTLLITALNKCFSLIHVVPDQILRFIGHSGESFGEADALGKQKEGFDRGAGDVKGAGEGAMGKVNERGKSLDAKSKQKDEPKQQLSASSSSKADSKDEKKDK